MLVPEIPVLDQQIPRHFSRSKLLQVCGRSFVEQRAMEQHQRFCKACRWNGPMALSVSLGCQEHQRGAHGAHGMLPLFLRTELKDVERHVPQK